MKTKELRHLRGLLLLTQVRSNFHFRNVRNQLDHLRDRSKSKLLEDSVEHQVRHLDGQQ
jgi:urease beta subunit